MTTTESKEIAIKAGGQLTTQEWKDLAEPLIDTLVNDGTTWARGEMPPVTYSLKARASKVLDLLDGYLKPANSAAIAGHVTLLLQHYYRDAKIPQAVADGFAMQWLCCLDSFPEWAIKRAVIRYLKEDTKGRRPVPGQIVALARMETSKYHALKLRCHEIDRAKVADESPPPSDEEREAVSRIVAEAVKNLRASPPPISEVQGKSE